MYFIGQTHIMHQLQDVLPYLYEDHTKGTNFLLRGPSGWGKTRMSFMMCNYLTGGDFEYCLGDRPTFNEEKRVHFIDEIHLIEHAEILYPVMDSGKYVIVLATNDVALLPEALSNRCEYQFIFADYTLLEMRYMSRQWLQCNIPESHLDYVIESGASNPRIVKGIVSKLNIALIRRPNVLLGLTLDQFKDFLKETFGIRDGMDIMCNRYLDTLGTLGGTASIQTISANLHIDANTLRYYVEPILLYKNRIRISSKGRSLT
jgi:Holliday junction resolvasome RuvABC ATP-dependent DNA helicase subunit